MKKTSCSHARPYSCPVQVGRGLRFDLRVSCDLEDESIVYAVCRFIRRSPALMGDFAGESYRLRLQRGKTRRSFVAPASLLELPGSWAAVSLRILPTGAEITRIGLYDCLPAAQRAAGAR